MIANRYAIHDEMHKIHCAQCANFTEKFNALFINYDCRKGIRAYVKKLENSGVESVMYIKPKCFIWQKEKKKKPKRAKKAFGLRDFAKPQKTLDF